jgi:hypothetical protein
MYRKAYAHTRQFISGLLLAIFVLVNITKALHTHHSFGRYHFCESKNAIVKTGAIHNACAICEFQLAKDASLTGQLIFVIAPVQVSPTYCRLLTAINPDRFLYVDGRGPPQA